MRQGFPAISTRARWCLDDSLRQADKVRRRRKSIREAEEINRALVGLQGKQLRLRRMFRFCCSISPRHVSWWAVAIRLITAQDRCPIPEHPLNTLAKAQAELLLISIAKSAEGANPHAALFRCSLFRNGETFSGHVTARRVAAPFSRSAARFPLDLTEIAADRVLVTSR